MRNLAALAGVDARDTECCSGEQCNRRLTHPGYCIPLPLGMLCNADVSHLVIRNPRYLCCISKVSGAEHHPNLQALEVDAMGADAALVSRGNSVPFSAAKKCFPAIRGQTLSTISSQKLENCTHPEIPLI